ncbi:MAG: TatD family hydrolase [Pseudomonadota bacterium]
MYALTDIGANLADGSFSADLDAVLSRATAAGVARMVVTGSSAPSNRRALELAREHPRTLRATAGCHPHHAAGYDDNLDEQIRRLAQDPLIVAVGECGLDYYRDLAPRDAQANAFARQLAIAADAGKPVFLHQRNAIDDFVAQLAPWRDRLPQAVAHCFTDGPGELAKLRELDLYIGVTGWICDERRGGALRSAVAGIPADRLLIETDAPYLLPRTLKPRPRTRRNEPQWLGEVLRVLAECRGDPPEELAAVTHRNAARFFDWPLSADAMA